MEKVPKETSCYSSSLVIKYAQEKGITPAQLYDGIENFREILENPLEWVGLEIWTKLGQNIETFLGNTPEILEEIGKEVTKSQISNFQLLFLKIAPLSLIVSNIHRHFNNNICKIIEINAILGNGQVDVIFTPKDKSKYSTQICDFNKGCTFATLNLKGYKNTTIAEVSCAARDKKAKACHYRLTWTPRSGLIRKLKDIFLFRFRDQQAIIQHMEENHRKLQDQYHEISQLYEKLVKSELKFRAIFENIQDVYFEIDLSGKILEISPSVTSVSLYKREELLNVNIKDICVNIQEVEDHIKQLKISDRISDYELQVRDKDGNIIFCTITARLIKEDRVQHKITGVLRDSTERKKAEEEKLRLQEQLRQSEKLKALGQLAGGIAHDFKNQLFGIAVNSNLIKKVARNNNQIVNYANNITKSAERSTDLTKQLLAFARKGKYKSIAIDLNSVVKDLVILLKRTIDKKIQVKMQLFAERSVISGDPGQIENALLNIALNARDAMPKGGTLTFFTNNIFLNDEYCLKSEYDITPGLYVKLDIKDTGQGMDDSALEHIFEPFFTTKEMGNGLGLSAVYGTVKEHKGAIIFDTNAGIGTTISIFLPISSSPVSKNGKEKDAEGLKENKKLLIVEDEEIVRDGAKEALEAIGFTVIAFPDGNSALKHFEKLHKEVDLILLDMILPDYRVEELFEKFQNINPSAKIILWSAYTLLDTVRSLREKGAIDFIDKSGDISEFIKKILSIVEKLN